MWKKTEMKEMLASVASYRSFQELGRLPLWEERLRANELELSQFAAFPEIEGEPIQTAPRPAAPRPAAAQIKAVTRERRTSKAATLAAKVRSGEASATEVAADYIKRAAAVADMCFFTAFDVDDLMRQATFIDGRIARGEDPGPLAGVPVPVKDYMYVRGYPRTGGTKAMPASVGHDDAPVVASIRAAGALIGGVTNLHELAYGATGINPHFGRVANPRHPGRIIGGSSSGSAGAVAAGLTCLAVGTDTSGSIRIPSAFAGVVGFKPTYERVSRAGVMPLAWSLDHVGPIADSVADAALLFSVMAGLPDSATVPVIGNEKLRIGKPSNHFYNEVDAEILANIEGVILALSASGHEVRSIELDGVEACLPIHVQTVSAEASQAYWQPLMKNPELLGEDVRVRLEVGQFLASVDYIKAQRMRTAMRDDLMSAFRDLDILITPTVAVLAPEIGAVDVVIDGKRRPLHPALTRFTTPFNQTGLPAITLPCGINADGLPIGLQLSAAYGNDIGLLRAAAIVEDVVAAL